jgi:hypothetical protein
VLAAGVLSALQGYNSKVKFDYKHCLQLECCLHCKITYTEEAFDKILCLHLECCLHCRATTHNTKVKPNTFYLLAAGVLSAMQGYNSTCMAYGQVGDATSPCILKKTKME